MDNMETYYVFKEDDVRAQAILDGGYVGADALVPEKAAQKAEIVPLQYNPVLRTKARPAIIERPPMRLPELVWR